MAGLPEHAELAIGARAVARDDAQVLDLLAGPELVDHVVDELEELLRELAHRYLGLLAEVDELRVHSPAHRPPLVLLDQAGHVAAEAEVPRAEEEELRADRLHPARDAEGLVDGGRGIADPEPDHRGDSVRAQVPPDLLVIVER